MVPAAAGDPFTFFMLSGTFRNPLLQFGHVLYAVQPHRQPILASSADVHMRIIETRHHKMFFQIHNRSALIG